MSQPLPFASSIQAERAIAHVKAVLRAAENSNQHGENMIALMDQATAMFQRIHELEQRLEDIASNAPAKEPRDGPTVGWTGRQTDAGDAFDEAVQQAFNEGYTRACWEMAQIADKRPPAPLTRTERFTGPMADSFVA